MVTIPSTQLLTYAIGQRKYLTAPSGGRSTYAYDGAGRITCVFNSEGNRTSYSYDAASRRTFKYLANGLLANFTYGYAKRILEIGNQDIGAIISDYAYSYHPAGNRTSDKELDGSGATWIYDTTNELLGQNRTGTSPYRDTFTFDSRGNRTVNNQCRARATTTCDVAKQIIRSLTAGSRTTYVFDSNGKQQIVRNPDGTRVTTTWDFENQPTQYNQPANTTYPVVTMAYNVDNQCIQKRS
jgi:YD repeat-containing protein